MAFTQQNEKDGYLFFAIAFNAVPGKTYAAQVVAAYEAGMTTQQIVNEFTAKQAFKDIYGDNLSNADFAQSFVANVVAGLDTATISAAVQAQAIADIEAALEAGLTQGDVIFNVINNISNKTVADAEWGPVVQLLQNKVAVAEALTEGEFALDTIDAGALQAPLALVSEKHESVADAIVKGGALKALLANALSADKAESDYAASLGLTFDAENDAALGTYADGDAVTSVADVTALVGARLDTAANDSLGINYAAYKVLTATEKSQKIAQAKTDASNDVALKKDALATANTNVNKVATLAKKGADLAAADAALLAAQKAQVLADAAVPSQVDAYNVGKAATSQVTETAGEFFLDASSANTQVIELVSGKYAFVAGTASDVQTGLKAVLDAANATLAADKAVTDATTAQGTANTAVTNLDADVAALNIAGVTTAKQLLATVTTASNQLKAAEKAVTDLDKALTDLSTYATQATKLVDLDKAVTDAADKLDDAGYANVTLAGAPIDVDTATLQDGVTVADKAVLFVSAATAAATALTNFKSDDHIYVGTGYTVNTTGDLTKGNNSALEVFFKTNAAGTATDLYIEQKNFGSGVAGAADGKLGDIIKITLTGVTADKLVFQDGMITVTA